MSAAARPARSIRTLLLAGGIGALLAVLGAAAWLSFAASEEEAQELFDARLATSARVLEALVARQVENATIAAPIVIALPGPLEAENHDTPSPLGHYYETKIAFQVRDGGGSFSRTRPRRRKRRSRRRRPGSARKPSASTSGACSRCSPAAPGCRWRKGTTCAASSPRSSRAPRWRRSSPASRCCWCCSSAVRLWPRPLSRPGAPGGHAAGRRFRSRRFRLARAPANGPLVTRSTACSAACAKRWSASAASPPTRRTNCARRLPR